jgi:hypothetical protein
MSRKKFFVNVWPEILRVYRIPGLVKRPRADLGASTHNLMITDFLKKLKMSSS